MKKTVKKCTQLKKKKAVTTGKYGKDKYSQVST